ncbi:Mu-like prophage tail protein gpP [Faunimonas pinastri]|uniref:Mu-like prophage tail protein gpP n=1 Tax=Faunimonas pinastri TaxID=1855383 RepID=A0A1H9GE23_9HYPH|nr:hypothetical protein [Faunimonas pinastri]SEQ48351.1 Mu-like prophage tail protein gpP [Faunimonas pinastri]
MPVILETVAIIADGVSLQGWQDVNITRSMEQAAISFAMKATNASWSPEAKVLRYGRKIEIRTTPVSQTGAPGSGDLLCTGAVDTYAADYGEGENKEIRIEGRSKARDGIDCPPVKHRTGRVEKKTLLQAAQEFDEFGIGFATDQVLKVIDKIQLIPGLSMFRTLENEARHQGLMLVGQPDGSVNITRAGTKRHAGALVLGQAPVNKMGVQISPKAKRSPIVVRGQRSLGTDRQALRQEHYEYDEESGTYRPHLVIPEGDYTAEQLKTRGKWQRLRMAGNGIQITARVSSWRDEAGALWTPGLLMAIKNRQEDIDQDMTLSSVTFSQSDGEGAGTRADLTFVDPRTHGGKKPQGTADAVYDPGDGLEE